MTAMKKMVHRIMGHFTIIPLALSGFLHDFLMTILG
jgi:hypothetical protein